jgi:hypothetical protein
VLLPRAQFIAEREVQFDRRGPVDLQQVHDGSAEYPEAVGMHIAQDQGDYLDVVEDSE